MNIKAITKKQMKGVLIIALLLVSAFLSIPTLFLQQSFANTTIYTVNNEIWINATGISPSGDGEPTYLELKLDVSQSADNDGNVHTAANEGDRAFSPSQRQEWLLFKDITRISSENPTDYYAMDSNAARYFGFQYANNTMNCSSIPGSYFESRLPAVSIGSSVREVTLLFDKPAVYAEAYCLDNGYTFLNVINASYEQVINYNALNTYRSKILETTMMTLEDTSLTGTGLQQQGWLGDLLIIVGLVTMCPTLIVMGIGVTALETPQGTTADPPILLELDPPPANAIENMTIVAINRFADFAEQALEAFLNGTIDLATYMAIVDQAGGFIFGALNNSVTVLEDLWRDYYNVSERLYDTYADMYDKYLQSFSASWTDWLTLMLIIIVVIMVLVIIYKVVSRKTADSAINAPQFLVAR